MSYGQTRYLIVLTFTIHFQIFIMSDANQSNVAIKMRSNEAVLFEVESEGVSEVQRKLNPNESPLITQNVPFKQDPEPISKWYIVINLLLNIFYLVMIVILTVSGSQLGRSFIIAMTVSLYLVYLVVAYHFSTLLPLVSLQSVHEYRRVFDELKRARCTLRFKYISWRSNIDEAAKVEEEQFEQVRVTDRSGVLYNIEMTHDVIFIKYYKKFYFSTTSVKANVYNSFYTFVEKARKNCNGPHGKFLLRGKEKIELIIEGMRGRAGFSLTEDNCYKWGFFSSLLCGLGVYYQFFMRGRVLRYQIDIVKQISSE